jgi:hypothetical protein
MFGAARGDEGWRAAIDGDACGRPERRVSAGGPEDPGRPDDLDPAEPARSVVLVPRRGCEPFRPGFSRAGPPDPAFTKTRCAPRGVRAAPVGLPRRLEPHFEALEAHDESGPWETGDEPAARARFGGPPGAIGALGDALGAEPGEDGGGAGRPWGADAAGDSDGDLDRGPGGERGGG